LPAATAASEAPEIKSAKASCRIALQSINVDKEKFRLAGMMDLRSKI
jgi:hypothetical protein